MQPRIRSILVCRIERHRPGGCESSNTGRTVTVGVRSHPGRSSELSAAPARPAGPLGLVARRLGQSPASHGWLGSATQVWVSRFDDGNMTSHSTVSLMVHGSRTSVSACVFHSFKSFFILNCSKRCAAKEIVQLQGHTWRLRLQAAY